jgi:hypothetical protein
MINNCCHYIPFYHSSLESCCCGISASSHLQTKLQQRGKVSPGPMAYSSSFDRCMTLAAPPFHCVSTRGPPPPFAPSANDSRDEW